MMKRFLNPGNNQQLSQGDFNLVVVIHYMALIGFAGHLLFIFLFFWLGVTQMAWLNIGSCAIFLCCFWLNWRGTPHLALLFGIFEVAAHAVLAVIYIGWESGFHYYIIGLTPLIFYSQSWRLSTKLLLTSLLCGLYTALYFHALLSPPLFVSDPLRLRAIGVVNIITLFIVFAGLAYYYRLAATNAEYALTQANLKLKHQAHSDALTHLANRHDLAERIDALVTAHRSDPEPFCLVLTDIDNFKVFNDTYGHAAGDLILIRVAETLRSCMREHDQVGRWGGEEFLVLLPGTHLDGGLLAAERMRQKVSSIIIQIGAVETNITMTFGVAEFNAGSDSADCIDRADQAMYQGKVSGKNCVKAAPQVKT